MTHQDDRPALLRNDASVFGKLVTNNARMIIDDRNHSVPNPPGTAGAGSQTPQIRIRLKLVGRTVNRDAIGTVIIQENDSERRLFQTMGGGSYLSQSTLEVTVSKVRPDDRITIKWPDGIVQDVRFSIPPSGLLVLIH